MTRILAIRDNLTRTTHYPERPVKPLDVSPYVAQLLADRARLAEDLAGTCRNDEWKRDRIEALEWTNKELCRLGAVPAGWDSVDTSVND